MINMRGTLVDAFSIIKNKAAVYTKMGWYQGKFWDTDDYGEDFLSKLEDYQTDVYDLQGFIIQGLIVELEEMKHGR